MQGKLVAWIVGVECMRRYGGCACMLQDEDPAQVPHERCRQQARVAQAALAIGWQQLDGLLTALKTAPGFEYDPGQRFAEALKKAQDWHDANRPQEDI
jgi:hypothetical protein